MPFTDVQQKFNNIAALPGKNDKRALLKSYLNNPLFAKVVKYMFTEDMTFNIKELPEVDERFQEQDPDVIFEALDLLNGKNGATAKDKQGLAEMCGMGAARDVVVRILKGKSDAGFDIKSVVTVAPGFIFKTPYQRCAGHKNLNRVEFPAIIQRKADGMFAYMSSEFSADICKFIILSRRGKSFHLFGELLQELKIYEERIEEHYPDPVFVGELTVLEEDGTTMPRQKGNGLLNKFIKGKGTPKIARRVMYTIWDVLPGKDFRAGKSDIPYELRWNTLMNIFNTTPTPDDNSVFMKNKIEMGESHRVQLIEAKEINDLKEAQGFYEGMRDQGEEGAILKDYKATWKDNTCATFAKMKHFVDAEFRVTGVVEGKGKYKGMMGALEIQSEDGIVTSKVGSGFPDSGRSLAYWRMNTQQIITVQFESLIQDKKTKKWSLNLPTFVEERFNEKTVANTFEYLEEL